MIGVPLRRLGWAGGIGAAVARRPAIARRAAPRPEVDEHSPDALPTSEAPLSQRGFRADCELGEGCARIAPVGEFDCSAVVAFERAMASTIELGCPIVIDLAGLSFIDSEGLWALTTTHTTCRQRQIPLRLLPGPAPVQDVFEVTGLYDLLPFAAA